MSRAVRHLLIAALIAAHGAVTLCGPGLHALPGWGHGSAFRPEAADDHSHGPGKSSHESTEDCQICHILAQVQLSPDAVAGVTGWLHVETATPVLVSAAPNPLALPPIARGPPAARPAQV